jgi:competence CoiA-like predicted nuclease
MTSECPLCGSVVHSKDGKHVGVHFASTRDYRPCAGSYKTLVEKFKRMPDWKWRLMFGWLDLGGEA